VLNEGRHCEERPAFARFASYGGFESAEARSAEDEAIQSYLPHQPKIIVI